MQLLFYMQHLGRIVKKLFDLMLQDCYNSNSSSINSEQC